MSRLEWSASDDGEGRGAWEGMASARSAAELAQALAEAQCLLARAEADAPGPRGADDEGGVWDAWLQQNVEADGWITLSLTLTGPWAWGEALLQPAQKR